MAAPRGKTAEKRALEREVQGLNRVTRNIVVRNTIKGAVAGALGGCILAELTGGSCGEGAVAGGLVGGVAGNAVGRAAAQKKREIVSAEQTLARVMGVQQRLAGVESNLRAVVRRQNSEIASLRRQVNAGQVTASSANRRINAINGNRSAVIQGLDQSRQNVINEDVKLAKLEKQSGQALRQERQAVRSTSNRIASLRNSVRLVSG